MVLRSSSAKAALKPPSFDIWSRRERSSAALAASAPVTVRAAAKLGDAGATLLKLAGVRSGPPLVRRATASL